MSLFNKLSINKDVNILQNIHTLKAQIEAFERCKKGRFCKLEMIMKNKANYEVYKVFEEPSVEIERAVFKGIELVLEEKRKELKAAIKHLKEKGYKCRLKTAHELELEKQEAHAENMEQVETLKNKNIQRIAAKKEAEEKAAAEALEIKHEEERKKHEEIMERTAELLAEEISAEPPFDFKKEMEGLTNKFTRRRVAKIWKSEGLKEETKESYLKVKSKLENEDLDAYFDNLYKGKKEPRKQNLTPSNNANLKPAAAAASAAN